MKPYEEIKFPNGYIRWVREGNEYVCRMTEEYMKDIKQLHEQKWVPKIDRRYSPDGTLLSEKIKYTPDGEWQDLELKEKNS